MRLKAVPRLPAGKRGEQPRARTISIAGGCGIPQGWRRIQFCERSCYFLTDYGVVPFAFSVREFKYLKQYSLAYHDQSKCEAQISQLNPCKLVIQAVAKAR